MPTRADIRLSIGGQAHETLDGWSVESDLLTPSDAFELELFTRQRVSLPAQLQEGTPCELSLAGDRVLTGGGSTTYGSSRSIPRGGLPTADPRRQATHPELARDARRAPRHDGRMTRQPEILRYAAQEKVDLVVLTSHRIDPANPEARWGTLSHKVGLLAPCPVLLVK